MALIEETLKPGANVSAIARQAGIAPAQLFGWRRKAMRTGVVQGEPRSSGSDSLKSRRHPPRWSRS
ncbi:transposase [Microvirga sp. GCM10011540]|uniref:transposase n=1 Tax=Microvirga sp. GCM10011540 TaxID=3317338 RepID=UPI0036127D99